MLLLLACCLFSVASSAQGIGDGGIQDNPVSSYLTGVAPLVNGGSIQQTYTANAYEQSHKIKNIVMLKVLEETGLYIPADFTATIGIQVDYGNSPSDLNTPITRTLTVSYSKQAGVKYDARNYISFDNVPYVKVTITSVSGIPVISGSFDTRQVLQLENELRARRYYVLGSNKTATFGTPNPKYEASDTDGLGVSWAWDAGTGNNATQLEWTWLEDELASDYISGGTINTAQLFASNATRVDLASGVSGYTIPLFYDGYGKLYYRIRATNYKPNGTATYGPWVVASAYAFAGHNNKLNWQVTTTYAEEGKRKTVMQYYDGLLRGRQTVTKDNTTNTTIVAETFYDAHGKAAIQVLPTPTMGHALAYTQGLNLFNGQTAGTNPASMFDLEPLTLPTGTKHNETPPLDSTSPGAAQYYSSSNPLLSTSDPFAPQIPKASGYPYTVTRYTPDATGRVMYQSGVGNTLKLGSGHEAKYFYGSAAQEELDGLFGTEAGNYTHYFKNMVSDANGQMSISYVDMHGRTIATALAGDPTNTGIAGLDKSSATHYPGQSGTQITRNLLDKATNSVKGNSIESINSMLIPVSTSCIFAYALAPQALQLAQCSGGTVCYDCLYNLEISITDESGDNLPIVRKFNNISIDTSGHCQQPIFANSLSAGPSSTISGTGSVSFTETLPPGSYSVRKTLTMSLSSMQRLDSLYMIKGLCTDLQQHLVDSVTGALVTQSGCGLATPPTVLTCGTCMDSLGTFTAFKAKYIASMDPNNLPSDTLLHSTYSADSASCARLCGTSSGTAHTLQNLRQMMLHDMTPFAGQYALEPDSVASKGTMYYKYNIFVGTGGTSTQTQPFYTHPYNKAANQDTLYYTPLGDIDSTVMPLQSLSRQAYTQVFARNWATQLLPFHPEYPKLAYAEKNLVPAYGWMDDFMGYSYADAISHNLIDATNGNILLDPFYSVTAVAAGTYQADINKKVSDTSFMTGLSMWQVAYGDAFCKSLADDGDRGHCYVAAPQYTASLYGSMNPDKREQIWGVFAGFYASARNAQLNNFINAQVSLADTQDLGAQNYILYFASNAQTAQQYKWTWYPSPTTPGSAPVTTSINDSLVSYTSGRCLSYIPTWKRELLQCTVLAGKDSATQADILATITNRMAALCQQTINQSNPDGSSTLPSGAMPNGDKSFEQIVNDVYHDKGIGKDTYCNPYVIESPKPYGKNPAVIQNYISVLDSCLCKRFSDISDEADAADFNSADLHSLNTYLMATYGDTITASLYSSMNSTTKGCPMIGETTTYSVPGFPEPTEVDEEIRQIALPSPQPQPKFLQCGFVPCNSCLTCGQLVALAHEFQDSFPSPYNTAPEFGASVAMDSATNGYNALFARFVNYRTGLQQNWLAYASAANKSACIIGTAPGCGAGSAMDMLNLDTPDNTTVSFVARQSIRLKPGFSTRNAKISIKPSAPLCTSGVASTTAATQTVICASSKPLTDTAGLNLVVLSPCSRANDQALSIAHTLYTTQSQRLLANFDSAYRAKCLSAQSAENFTVTYTTAEFHYTLYYYDMAGNLLKTVPPKGAKPDFSSTFIASVAAARLAGTQVTPSHTFATDYRYNSLNQVTAQKTPDAGTSNFWYDRLGRLAVSQNAKQQPNNQYSYTQYDALGRISEVGQLQQSTAMSQTTSQDSTALKTWVTAANSTREQITRTVYDDAYAGTDGIQMVQDNLRTRVSYSQLWNNYTDTYPASATYYTYDVHGNVDTLLQDFGNSAGVANAMNTTSNRFKKMVYDFDLISGKVNQVSYQPGKADAFYHQYNYDAENRITHVLTSRDSIVWEQDAAYSYYKHGPLARTVLGQQQVQGLDYAYTLQGWLKGVNSTAVGDGNFDIGADGKTTGSHSNVARDAFGYSLNYFGNDYIAVGSGTPFAAAATTYPTLSDGVQTGTALYNGNISSMMVNIPKLGSGNVYSYRYDQLNRLVGMNTNSGLSNTTNTFTAAAISDYKERIGYDPNGNIESYLRNGDASRQAMDDLTYGYKANTNQLDNVSDAATDASAGVYGNYKDIKQGQSAGNYTYDAIGNLATDNQEGITNINWSVYGKILSVVKSSGTINYTYDVTGNRITKTASGKSTFYVRDASGSVMSVYESPDGTNVTQTEKHLYGSSRIGMVTIQTVADQTITLDDGSNAILSTFTRGEKVFEESNHLGNVLVTVNDKKIQHTTDGSGVDYYDADIASANDYYPFGMSMPSRKYIASGSAYRYGFNGKENDKETGYQDYGMRTYDPLTGRFISVDPLTQKYPGLTPYQFASNRPIDGIDQDGLEWSTSNPLHNLKTDAQLRNQLAEHVKQAANNAALQALEKRPSLKPADNSYAAQQRSKEYRKQQAYNEEMDARAAHDPVSYGGPGMGQGLARDPFVQAAAATLAPEFTLFAGGVSTYEGIRTQNYGMAAQGSLMILGGGLGAAGRLSVSAPSAFAGGGTKLMSSAQIEAFPGSTTFGNPASTFIAPTTEIDALLAQGLPRSDIAAKLGITDPAFLQGNLIRVDVAPRLLRQLNLRAATGGEIGANNLFVPGGKTIGGVTEGVVNGIPTTGSGVTSSTVPPAAP
ncbi:RHS repeat-associated core domain-containing protein [Parasediminibacterium sp. JCM 36343]|uniref:RHS repeat-associated core domain-containing protein n=1 Tax=Parasediminibacterium sp. JCM 36343 TaxID=3374279 RepID=UPI003978ACBD